MPELPEVETIKEALKRSVEGARIDSVVVRNRKFRQLVPDDFEKNISNSLIKKIHRKAKYLVFDLDNGHSIVWHLGMSGKIKIVSSSEYELEKHDHVIIKTNKDTLIYNDARRFGLITDIKSDDINSCSIFCNVGMDPFDSGLTPEYFLNKLKNKKTAIKILLLDQSIINGIGNIYASEALFEAGILPTRESCSITNTEALLLIEAIKKTLNKAIKAGGSTLRDYRKPDGSMGYFQNQHCVYNKEGKRCLNCTCNIELTGGIKRIVQGGRSTYYCQTKQK